MLEILIILKEGWSHAKIININLKKNNDFFLNQKVGFVYR